MALLVWSTVLLGWEKGWGEIEALKSSWGIPLMPQSIAIVSDPSVMNPARERPPVMNRCFLARYEPPEISVTQEITPTCAEVISRSS